MPLVTPEILYFGATPNLVPSSLRLQFQGILFLKTLSGLLSNSFLHLGLTLPPLLDWNFLVISIQLETCWFYQSPWILGQNLFLRISCILGLQICHVAKHVLELLNLPPLPVLGLVGAQCMRCPGSNLGKPKAVVRPPRPETLAFTVKCMKSLEE